MGGSRKFNRWIASLPPIDWAWLASQRKMPTRKGDKRPLAEVERLLASRAANLAARRRARWKEIEAEKRPGHQLRHRQVNSVWNLTHRIVHTMAKGEWYARADIQTLTGLRRSSLKIRMAVLTRQGVLERAPNADWRPAQYRGRVDLDTEGHEPPRWLYRLAEGADALKAEADYLA